MENALLVGVSRQMALRRELDVIANNMANVSTNGFKAQLSRSATAGMPNASTDGLRRADRRPDFVVDAPATVDLSTGAIEVTRNPLDVAIQGDGFFVVETPAGERYTRNGAFQLDVSGRLVTSDGFVVKGSNGPITFDRTETGITVAPDGTIASEQAGKGRIRVVRFEDPRALRNEGENTFSASGEAVPAGATSRLRSGALERSNVRPVVEMTRLIEVNRSYASVSGMIGRMDEMKRSALSRLADVQAA